MIVALHIDLAAVVAADEEPGLAAHGLAASTLECTVEKALRELLERRAPFDYATLRELAAPTRSAVPQLVTPEVPDLRVYDALLAGATR